MKKILASLVLLFILPALAVAVPTASIWEKAAISSNPALVPVNLYGINGALTTTFEPVWPESAVYTPLAVAMTTPYCASSDANDTSAGTGARTITVTGINTSFAAFSETVTMNGQTSVNLATANILLINSLETLTAGSGGFNAGIIQCGTGANTSGDPAVTHAYMPISSATTVAGAGNKSMSFIYGVPANKTLLCRNISAGSVFATAASGIQIAIDGYTNLGIMKRFFGQHAHNTGTNPSLYLGTISIPEKTIIVGKLAGPTGSNVGPASLQAECVLVDNGYLSQPGNLF